MPHPVNGSPTYLQMLRAPFFSSILAPLGVGTLVAVLVGGHFSFFGLVFVLLMGLGLHSATNVYNDIYDTLQGADPGNPHRNEFSGGSGVLVRHPELLPTMTNLARGGLLIAFIATIGLFLVVPTALRITLVGLFLLSAFFAKFYTASPFRLAYRGLGEISVWFAFGPMAVLVGAVSQGVGFEREVLLFMAPTGLSTLSILWIGQMIDFAADEGAGKRGAVIRMGTARARYGYLLVQCALVVNVVAAALFLPSTGPFVGLVLLPYAALFPKIWKIVSSGHSDPDKLKPAAGLNVLLHLMFSVAINLGLGLALVAG